MVSNAVRSIWAEPRAPHPPARVWRDWVLVAVLVLAAASAGAILSRLHRRVVLPTVVLEIVLGILIPALVLTIPIHVSALFVVLAVMTVMGVTNHMGWEMFPRRVVNGPAGRWRKPWRPRQPSSTGSPRSWRSKPARTVWSPSSRERRPTNSVSNPAWKQPQP
jgi:hypothetical protein